MANEIQTAPNTTPTTDADWAAELNLRELSMKGYDGISLTEWASGDTDKPEIAAGSVIEIDGAIAKFASQTALTDAAGIADGWCYIKFVVSGSDVVPTLTNTFGTWDTAKQGFYSGNDRYSLHKMYRSGAVTKIFTYKQIVHIGNVYDDLNDGVYIEDDSSIYPGAKVKYRVYENIGNGGTTITFTHGITNLLSSVRLIDIRTCLYPTFSKSLIRGGEGDSSQMSSYQVNSTTILMTFSSTTTAYTYRTVLSYI